VTCFALYRATNRKEALDEFKAAFIRGWYKGWFPSKERVNLPKFDYPFFPDFISYMTGYMMGVGRREELIQTGEWIKIGGAWGPIPYGTAEDWRGQEEIVSKPPRIAPKGLGDF